MDALLLITVSMVASDTHRAIDFDTEIVPVLTRFGCNAGACHGAGAGRGGLHLSLFGAEPANDYNAIVRELGGRRLDFNEPDESLLLTKPTGRLEHGGGLRFESSDPAAQRIRLWIAQGAARRQLRQLESVRIAPARHAAKTVGEPVQLKATAVFTGGQSEDVTDWTVFRPDDSQSIHLDRTGRVATVLRPGRHVVVARFLDRINPIEILAPMADAPVDHSLSQRKNYIDEEILEMLSLLRLPVAPACDDVTFLRRASLDLTGRLPTPGAARQFVADTATGKRAQLIDELLDSKAFDDYWTYKLATMMDLFPRSETEAMQAFHSWLRGRIAERSGWDRIVRELLLAEGDSHVTGPAAFYRIVRDARSQAEHVGTAFLGVRLRCANCHNHPLDRWTQDDYHGLAAVFAALSRGRIILRNERMVVTHPKTGMPAVPRIPGGSEIKSSGDPRAHFSDWLLDRRQNSLLARSLVNRLWKALMGRGLVEPDDDLRTTNPPTHALLLDRLADDFAQNGYDVRRTLRTIAGSAVYERSIATSRMPRDDRFYSQALARPLDPAVVADAIADVTGVSEPFASAPTGTRAVALANPRTPSVLLEAFGQCLRNDSCNGGFTERPALSAVLRRINGPAINLRLSDPNGRLMQWLGNQVSSDAIVDEVYLRSYSRRPSGDERQYWRNELSKAGDRAALVQDFLWAILNSREFVTNH